jgi:hypothetical protein
VSLVLIVLVFFSLSQGMILSLFCYIFVFKLFEFYFSFLNLLVYCLSSIHVILFTHDVKMNMILLGLQSWLFVMLMRISLETESFGTESLHY